MNDFLNDLIPKNPNLIKIRNKKSNAHSHNKTSTKQDVPKVELISWSDEKCNPFLNAKEFFGFFKSIVSYYRPIANFCDYGREAVFAATIMDKLIDMKRDNTDFLKAWIKYYIDNFLKGNKSINSMNTSLNKFGKTLNDFSRMFIS